MSALDIYSNTDGLGAAQYKPTGFGEIALTSAVGSAYRQPFGMKVLEEGLGFHERDKQLKGRFSFEELKAIKGTSQDQFNKVKLEDGVPLPKEFSFQNQDLQDQVIDDAIIKGREIDPTRWGDIKTSEEIKEQVRNKAREAIDISGEIASKAEGNFAKYGGSIVGSVLGSFTDPINMATLPLGATSGMGILKAMKAEALVNAATEAFEAPFVANWQKELGYKYGVGDAVLDITTAGAGGAALTGIIRGVKPAVESLVRGLDKTGKYIGSKSQPILDKIGNSEKLPSLVRDAAKYMSRVAHVDENNPLRDLKVDETEFGLFKTDSVSSEEKINTKNQDIVLNRQTLQDTQDAFKNYEQPVYDERLNIVEQKPISAYHGTHKDFREFKLQKDSLGIHFGTKEQAHNVLVEGSAYNVGKKEEGRIIEAKLDISNPLRLEDKAQWESPIELATQLEQEGILNKEESIRLGADLFDKKLNEEQVFKKLREAVKNKGYDAIVYENKFEGKGNSYIVFDEKKIKTNPNPKIEQAQSLVVNSPENDLLFRPNDALASIQRDVETLESLNTSDTFNANFERFLKDNPDLKIETEAGTLTLKEIKEQIMEDETILSAIRTCAIGK